MQHGYKEYHQGVASIFIFQVRNHINSTLSTCNLISLLIIQHKYFAVKTVQTANYVYETTSSISRVHLIDELFWSSPSTHTHTQSTLKCINTMSLLSILHYLPPRGSPKNRRHDNLSFNIIPYGPNTSQRWSSQCSSLGRYFYFLSLCGGILRQVMATADRQRPYLQH